MVRPHKGQIDVAANMLQILQDSKLTTRQGQIRVQDAYSLYAACLRFTAQAVLHLTM